MDVRLPDGTVVTNVPEGITQTELVARVGKMNQTPAERIASDPISTGAWATAGATPAELIVGSAPGRFLLEPARGLLELGSNLIPGANRPVDIGNLHIPGAQEAVQSTGELIKRGRAAYDNTGLDIAGIAGQVASPAVLKVGKLVPAGANLLQKALGSAATGATAGALTPTEDKGDFWKEKGMQTGTGAAVGAVLPPAGALLKGVLGAGYRAIEPIMPKLPFMETSGPEAIWNRFKDKLAGPAKEKIVQALMQARELVPGSSPTVGEAIAHLPGGSPIASLQQQLGATRVVSPGTIARAHEQEAARAGAIGEVARTPTELAAAKSTRASEAAANYGVAGGEMIPADSALKELLQRPSMTTILGRATDLAKERGDVFKIGQDLPAKTTPGLLVSERGVPLTSTTTPAQVSSYPVKSLHYIKMAMDDLLKNPERFGIGASEAQAIGGTRAKFTQWLGEKSPAYDFARSEFATASRPINAMEIGQTLQDKLQAPLGATERAATFAQAVRDAPRTIKTATGSPRYASLSEVLTPQQVSAVEGVGSDLGRKAQFERLARGTRLNEVPGTVESPIPNLWSRPASITNYIARKVFGHDLQNKIGEIAGPQLLDPKAFAASLADKPLSVRKRLIDELLQRTGYPIVSGAPAAAVGSQY